ncbi:hypothetical protein [Klebsiella pneumoniae]
MRNINLPINRRKGFDRESLVAIVNDQTRGDLRTSFSWANN